MQTLACWLVGHWSIPMQFEQSASFISFEGKRSWDLHTLRKSASFGVLKKFWIMQATLSVKFFLWSLDRSRLAHFVINKVALLSTDQQEDSRTATLPSCKERARKKQDQKRTIGLCTKSCCKEALKREIDSDGVHYYITVFCITVQHF